MKVMVFIIFFVFFQEQLFASSIYQEKTGMTYRKKQVSLQTPEQSTEYDDETKLQDTLFYNDESVLKMPTTTNNNLLEECSFASVQLPLICHIL